ncbi:MAG: CapA family protein [Coriobacteriia bacterium]|nr:CapA family protein [Coriobacteriia bacterium]
MPARPTHRTEAGREARQLRRKRLIIVAASVFAVLAATAAAGFVVRHIGPSTAAPAEPTPTLDASAGIESTYSAVATVPPAPSGPTTITVAAVGDMHFDRQVRVLINKSGGTAPLAEVASQLAAADITVGNLESTLSDLGERRTDKDYTFKGDPRGVEALAAAGIDFVSLANNHALDCGTDAMLDTIARLDANGIGHSGAGADKAAAWAPAVRDVNGTTVAYLAFSHILPNGFVATNTRAGIAQGRMNMTEVEAAIRAADATYDYVLVSFHWGIENVDDCNAEQVTDAHKAIDAGADMVLAHHPHVIQAVEYYNGKLIAYSLGDFVFDHYSRKTGEAFVLEAEIGPSGIGAVRVTPVYLDQYGRPEYVTGQAAATILERLKAISAKRNTVVEISGDSAAVIP